MRCNPTVFAQIITWNSQDIWETYIENQCLRLRFDTSDENLVADIVSNICPSDYDASNLNHVFLPSLLAKIRDGVQKLILRSVSNFTAALFICAKNGPILWSFLVAKNKFSTVLIHISIDHKLLTFSKPSYNILELYISNLW